MSSFEYDIMNNLLPPPQQQPDNGGLVTDVDMLEAAPPPPQQQQPPPPPPQQQQQQQQKQRSPVYVSLSEQKEPSGKSMKRTGSGYSYIIKFYLVDTEGKLHHCVTGVDTGDSHYEYSAEPGWPALFCHNRAEVKAWAERQISGSQTRANFHTDVVEDVLPKDGSKPKLPVFVSYREEKEDRLDGRHCLRWYLIDGEGHSHLAVTGEEKDTKDGHYHYKTEPVFTIASPLEAGNQDVVHRWLEAMVVHPGIVPKHGGSGKAPSVIGGGITTGVSGGGVVVGSPRVVTTTGVGLGAGSVYTGVGGTVHSVSGGGGVAGVVGGSARGGGRGRGRGRLPPSGNRSRGRTRGRGRGGDSLLRAATSNAARRGRGGAAGWRADPDKEAREVVAAELRRWAFEEALSRERVKNAAIHYTTDSLEDRELDLINRCLPILQSAAANPNSLPSSTTDKRTTLTQNATLLSTLGALRELSHAYVPLSLVAHPGIKEALGALKAHPHPDISHLASLILEQWLRNAVTQILALSNPHYVTDPRTEIEEGILMDPVKFDSVVAATTSRELHLLLPPTTHQQGAAGQQVGHTPATPGVGLQPGSETDMTIERRNLEGSLLEGEEGDEEDGVGEMEGVAEGVVNSQQRQQQQQQPTEGGIGGGFDMDPAPSAALVDNPMQSMEDEDGAKILPDFQQKMAARGIQF